MTKLAALTWKNLPQNKYGYASYKLAVLLAFSTGGYA